MKYISTLREGERMLVDCGLTDEGRRAAALLSDMNTKLLTPQELAAYYTEEDTTEQGR